MLMTDTQASFSSVTPTPTAGRPEDGRPAPPQNWREALVVLLASRAALIRIEAGEAASSLRRRVAVIAALVLCTLGCWALLLAGGIAAVAQATGCAWHWIALGAGLIHLLAVLILAQIARRPMSPAFQATKAEFQKDREWFLKI
jgi:Putative Actinobacterial Holin-X, holin superfamily III